MNDEIIIPQSLADYQMQQTMQEAMQESKVDMEKRKLAERKNMQKQRASRVRDFLKKRETYQQLQANPALDPLYNEQVIQQFQQDYDTMVNQTRQQFKDEFDVELPVNQDPLEFVDEVNTSLEIIGDDRYVEMSDLDVKQFSDGKIRISIGKDNVPFMLQKLASVVRKLSSVNVKSRVLDVRQIADINSKMLNNGFDGSLLLSPVTLSFRPTINNDSIKRTDRVMISVTGDYEVDGNFLFYMQHEKKRFVCHVKHDRFSSNEDYILFLANAVNDFFIVGFDSICDRLLTETDDVYGLDRIGALISDTREFTVGYCCDGTNGTTQINIMPKNNPVNSWLRVSIFKGNLQGTYGVTLTSINDYNFYQEPFYNKPLTIDMLQNNIVNMLRNWYAMNWNEDLNAKEQNDTNLLNKFVIVKMRSAVMEIINMKNQSPMFGIVLNNAYSRQETAGFMPNKEMAEVLTGKTANTDYFILTCFKNPNSGKMTFIVEYSSNGQDGQMVSDDFTELLENTRFLYDDVKIIN